MNGLGFREKVLLFKNLLILTGELKAPASFEKLKGGFIVRSKRPVVVKALIHKLMLEQKMAQGSLIQFQDCVTYHPTGHASVDDRYYEYFN